MGPGFSQWHRLTPWVASALVLGWPAGARAHDADLLFIQLSQAQSSPSQVHEQVTLTAAALAALAPIDADGDGQLTQSDLDARGDALNAGVWNALPLTTTGGECRRQQTGAVVRESAIELWARFDCPPGDLQQRYEVLSVLSPGFRVVIDAQLRGVASQHFAEGNHRTVLFPSASLPSSSFSEWISLGIAHIFGGLDHLAFLAALLFGAVGWRRVLGMVTAFTLAHSLTRGVAAVGWVRLGPAATRAVELAIAASIVLVALENLVRARPTQRAAVAFGFGLVHGFGFASALKERGLGGSVAKALFGFNLGVELGQAAVVLALFPLILWSRGRPAVGAALARGASLLILLAGGYWVVARALN